MTHADARTQAVKLIAGMAIHRALARARAPAAADREAPRHLVDDPSRPPPPSLVFRLWKKLLNAGRAGGDASAAADPGMATITTRFNITNPRAVSLARAQAGRLIVEISNSSRREISSMVAQALQMGIAPRPMARQLSRMVTLNSTQQQAVLNLTTELRTAQAGDLVTRFPPRPGVRQVPGFRVRVPRGGLTQSSVRKLSARYAAQQLNLRARTIARSGAHFAANGGQRELWRQSMDSGQMRRDTERVWITAGDSRVRPAHEAVDGEKTGMEEDFSIGVEPGEETNCRCGQAIAPREGVGPPGTGIPAQTGEPRIQGPT